MSEYVFGVGKLEEMDDQLCLCITKKSYWEEKGCMDDRFYSDVNESLKNHKIHALAENMYSYYDGSENSSISEEELRKIAEEIGLIYCQEFENFIVPCREDEEEDF